MATLGEKWGYINLKVIKRDGRAVEYDSNKIILAIEKANKEVGEEKRASKDEILSIINFIESLDKKRILVEDIQDIIEQKLMELKKYDLAKKYNTLDKLMAASEAELQSIPDIGPILAQNIIIFFNNPENIELINNLKSIGMNTTYLGTTTKENENFIGKRFVVTGTLQKYTRDEIQALIEENGGLWSSSVTKNTAAVIVGDNPGSKYDKAKELNIPIWSETDFEEQLKSE